jgi:hypothetical protein
MLRTLGAGKSCFKCFAAIIGGLNIKLNTNIKNINSQNSVISMELLRIINVKIVNWYKKSVMFYYNFKKAVFIKFPGDLIILIKNSYGLFMGRLARG